MTEFYYEHELNEILGRLEPTLIGQYGYKDGLIQSVSSQSQAKNIRVSLRSPQRDNPLVDYKAYLLWESLFMFDWINQYRGFLVGDVPMPLYCFKLGSRDMTTLWKQQTPPFIAWRKDYYNQIQVMNNHLPSTMGELYELEFFMGYMRDRVDLDLVDDSLGRVGLSYDSLTGHVLHDGWKSHPDLERWNRVYSLDDWLYHGVL